jgi:hypothetical protein
VANRILSQILADWGLSHHWKEPTFRNNNLWKYSCSINRRVDNRIRKFIFFIKTNISFWKIFFFYKYLFLETFSAEFSTIKKMNPALHVPCRWLNNYSWHV